MCQLVGTVLHVMQVSLEKPTEINLYCHFELATIEISQGRVEGYLTVASYMPSVSLPGGFIKSS